MSYRSSSAMSSGIELWRVIRSRSVVPPMPRHVNSARHVPCRNSIPSAASSVFSFESSTRMMAWMLRPEQDHQFVTGSADISSAYGKNGVARFCLLQQKFDGVLHGPQKVHIFVSSFTDGRG